MLSLPSGKTGQAPSQFSIITVCPSCWPMGRLAGDGVGSADGRLGNHQRGRRDATARTMGEIGQTDMNTDFVSR